MNTDDIKVFSGNINLIHNLQSPILSHLPNTQNAPIDVEKINLLRIKIKDTLELNNTDIPNDIKISTMTLEGKFATSFHPWNIFRYIKRSKDGIVNVVKGNSKKKKKDNESDVDENGNIKEKQHDYRVIKSKARKGKKSKNRQSDVFLNQVTVSINVNNKEKPVSVKIFNNGTVHFTGCVTIDNLLESTYKLCTECRRNIAVLNDNGKIKDIKFVDDPDVLRVENLFDTKVDMINCIFVAPFKIDRPKLQVIMKADGYNAVYDSNGHAGVKIKYVSTGKKITIFVFESGSIIIILGKQGFGRINEIFTFIYKYLLDNYESIVKEDNITTSVILDFLTKEKEEEERRQQSVREAEKILKDSKNLSALKFIHEEMDKQILKRGRPKINKDYDNLINIVDIENTLNRKKSTTLHVNLGCKQLYT
jgi:TATA-box binding protein (TBP) (component of TFIID and TFIIIB)